MPFQKTFRILLEEDNTDGSILDSFGGASFLALNGTDTNSQPEVIECHRRLKDTIDVPTGRQVTIGTGTSKTTFFPDGDTFTGEA